ncbi:MAG: LysM peptidoglycan-binding domain-containing protein [Verrucomicrobia bacterium]|jgi:LysM repeat protein|nr:LysM peptidoglycan-binding domain-containing protein [Verrucomicrobiota bacterium]
MDTISRENNNMLPIGGILVGLVGVVLGGIALAQASKANKGVADHQPAIEKVGALETQVSSASSVAEKAAKDVRDLTRSTQEAFNAVGGKLGEFQTTITKIEEAMKKPAPAPAGKKGAGGGEVVAGPGEYVVKAGDGGTKIARTLGVSIQQLQAVNPGVNWNKLSVGQKLKVPQKK